jgi:peptidoglycan/LPS O-acetylase OafA/YrhL
MATLAEPRITAVGETYDQPTAFPSQRRIPALDGLRGAAILVIMLHHFVTMPAARGFEIPFVLAAKAGWVGVDLFFVLSGFLITGTLVDSRGAAGYARSFYARRALRILPLYMATVAVLTISLPLAARFDPECARKFGTHIWWYWTQTTNIMLARAGNFDVVGFSTPHFWSLAVEEQFYLVWPILVALCPPRHLASACLTVAAVSVILRPVLLANGTAPLAIYTLTPTRMDGLALGGALAVARRSDSLWRLVKSPAQSVARLPAAGWLGVIVLGVLGMALLDPAVDHNAPAMQAIGFPMIAAVAAVVLAAALCAPVGSPLERWLTAGWLRTLGRYSYGLYVLHYPLAHLLWSAGVDPRKLPAVDGSRLPAQLLVIAAASSLSFGAAWVSYQYLESPFLRFKRIVPVRLTRAIPTPGRP